MVTDHLLAGQPARLSLGDNTEGGFQVRLFRRTVTLDRLPATARLEIFAEHRYHAWINGIYLGRGPIQHHPDQFPVDAYDLSPHLRTGSNVLAILVQASGSSMHNHVNNGEPGLMAQLTMACDGRENTIVTDGEWRVTAQAGWLTSAPRRSWAIDYVEIFDAGIAPRDWQAIDFDDSSWRTPDIHRPAVTVPGGTLVPRPVPALVAREVPPHSLIGRYRIDAPPLSTGLLKGSGDLGRAVMDATWTSLPLPRQDLLIPDLTATHGQVLCFDFGQETVGQILLDCDCPGPGIIEIGWSEVAENGRPLLVRKGVGYIDRVHAVAGRVRFEPIQFGAMRYVVLVLRGFDGPVRVRKLAIRATEPDLQWPGSFTSSDERLNRIFSLCALSHQVGTQDVIMDCPSREQAAYVGDGMPVGRWILQLSGDLRHWKYLVREQFRRQSPQGLVRSSIFSGRNDTLVDYTLLAVTGTRDYLLYSRDIETIRQVLPACHRAMGYFDGIRDPATGPLCTWHRTNPTDSSWENPFDPALPNFDSVERMNLFIDHPGLGWHNQNEAGIDRRGMSAALNGFYILAKRALADLEDAVDNPAAARRLREESNEIAAALRQHCYDAARRVFVDGLFEGRRLQQVSEQTNTLAVAAGCLDDADARELLERLLTSDDPSIARNGPYFWTYLFPELTRLGLHRLALDRASALWGRMLDGGATTLWETFAGDDLDTWCHPWSAAVQEFLQTGIAGLPSFDATSSPIQLKPRIDLLPEASASLFTPWGWFSLRWRRERGVAVLAGAVPPGQTAELHLPDGTVSGPLRGAWEYGGRS